MSDWGPLEDGGLYDYTEFLDTHICTPEELGLEGDNPAFYPLDKAGKSVVTSYQKKFLCITKEKSKINGNFSSLYGRNVRIRLMKCRD